MSRVPNKLIAVLNKSLEPGRAMNALGHMAFGLGARLGVDDADLVDYVTQDATTLPGISKMPFIIARGSGGKIGNLIEKADATGIRWAAFTDTMTIGSWDEQVERTSATELTALTFYGIALYGPGEDVNALTRKFSLWR